jgi:hypothetical protein
MSIDLRQLAQEFKQEADNLVPSRQLSQGGSKADPFYQDLEDAKYMLSEFVRLVNAGKYSAMSGGVLCVYGNFKKTTPECKNIINSTILEKGYKIENIKKDACYFTFVKQLQEPIQPQTQPSLIF